MSDIPWLCARDFNEVKEAKKKWGGSARKSTQMNSFRQAIDDSGLNDLGFCDNPYTWSKGCSPETRIAERLDRALASVHWSNLYSNTVVYHLPSSHSNHIPIMIATTSDMVLADRKKRFEEMWVTNEECRKVILDTWNSELQHPMERFTANRSQVLAALTHWGRSSFGNIPNKVKSVKEQLAAVQGIATIDPTRERALK